MISAAFLGDKAFLEEAESSDGFLNKDELARRGIFPLIVFLVLTLSSDSSLVIVVEELDVPFTSGELDEDFFSLRKCFCPDTGGLLQLIADDELSTILLIVASDTSEKAREAR